MSFSVMKFLSHINLDQIPTFLPKSLVPDNPKYFVWFTGTLGQAEWLISHSSQLRGLALPLSCPKSPNDLEPLVPWNLLPKKLTPLLALEQPDLLVTDAEGIPLLTIEITEQQPFGLNAQQRMGRFWSAIANRIPCIYLLPIEGYQIEKASKGVIQAFEEKDPKKRKLMLRIAQLPKLTLSRVEHYNIKTASDLEEAIGKEQIHLEPKAKAELHDHFKKHLSPSDGVAHVREVDVQEFVHKVGSGYQKAYIRKAGIPGSMLLSWFKVCNSVVPSAVFQLPISYKTLFRSNGRVHTILDKQNPHLSFRNLPPSPGSFPAANQKMNSDEITLFFRMVDSVIGCKEVQDVGREYLTNSNEFFSAKNIEEQQILISNPAEFNDYKSADFRMNSKVLRDLLQGASRTQAVALEFTLNYFQEFNIYKMFCGAATRSLGDPYTGALAVRDVLFTRDLTNSKNHNLLNFNRESGLVFWTDLVGEAATRHKFMARKVDDVYNNAFNGSIKLSTQEKINRIVADMNAENVPKDIRAHILFSDLIIVRREHLSLSNLEVYFGVPSLLRLGIIDHNSKFLRSLRI